MKLNKLLIVGCLSIAAFASCKKSSSNSKIVGTWDMKQLAIDYNENGVMDASEVINIDSVGSGTIIFNSDGTGSEHVSYMGLIDSTISIKKWVLQNNDQDLIVTENDGTTMLSHITVLTNTDLTIEDTTKPMTWTVCKKH